MSDGIRVAALEELPAGQGLKVSKDVTGTDDNIAILRDEDGSVWALNDTCTHELASLSEGWIEDGVVECPLHGSQFCLRNGKVLSLPATKDTVAHRVEVVDGEIYLFPGVAP